MTRKLIFVFTLSLTLSTLAFAQASTGAPASSASAAAPAHSNALPSGPAPTKVGVIDIQAAIFNTNEGRRDIEALSKKFDPKQAELKSLSDELDSLKKQLNAQTDKLNEEERASRVHAIEQKQKNFQRVYEDAQTDFQNQQNELVSRIGGKMMDVLRKYADTNNLAVVIDASTQASPVLYAAQQVNITPAIIDAYNAQSSVPAQPVSAPSATRPPSKPVAPSSTTKKPATSGTTPRN